MKFIDLTIPLGIATPPWPTYDLNGDDAVDVSDVILAPQ